jgi:O-antigen ligase
MLFLMAIATLDVSALSVYRYLLISDVLLLGAALTVIAERQSSIVYVPKLIQLLFVVYLISTALAFLRPVDPSLGLLTWLHSAFLMMVYVPAATSILVIRPDLRWLVLPAMLASTTLQALVTVLTVAGGLNWQTGTRIAGPLGSVHVWVYAASIAAAVGLLMMKSWPLKVAGAGSFAVIAAAEVFRRSRMLWIASVVAASLFGFLRAKNKATALLLAVLVSFGLVVAYTFELYHPAIQSRIAATLRPTQTPDLVARLQVVRDLGGAFVDSPFIGLGVRQSPRYLSETPAPPPVVEIHNPVMHAAVEGGIGAALALVLLPVGILLLWIAARASHLVTTDRMLIDWAGASLLAIYLAAQLTPALYEHTFYLLLAFLASFAAGDRILPKNDYGSSDPVR